MSPWSAMGIPPQSHVRNPQAALMRAPFPGGLVIAMLLLGRRVSTQMARTSSDVHD